MTLPDSIPPLQAAAVPASGALSQDVLAKLADIIESRKPANGGDPDKSYTAPVVCQGH